MLKIFTIFAKCFNNEKHLNTMQNKEKVIELGEKLPYGSKKEIKRRTGIGENTIINFFKGKNVRYDKAIVIMKEANHILDT